MIFSQRSDSATAIAFLLVGVLGGLSLDLCAKALLADYSLTQFVFLRSLIGIAIIIVMARQFGGLRSLTTARWRWHLLRTVMAIGAMYGFFFGLARMPLVNALTLGFTALIAGAIAGYLIWDEVPDRWVVTGALVIIASGLFVIYREFGSKGTHDERNSSD